MYAINLAIKIAFMAIFVSLLYLVIDYFLSMVVNNLNIPFICLFSYLGVLQGTQVVISFAIASYVVNQIISYIRN